MYPSKLRFATYMKHKICKADLFFFFEVHFSNSDKVISLFVSKKKMLKRSERGEISMRTMKCTASKLNEL